MDYSAHTFEAPIIRQSAGHTSPIPAVLVEFSRLFNQGEYWQSHEALEQAWKQGRSDFFHGLILLASAFVHGERRNRHGVLAQLDKAEAVLNRFRPHYLGVDLDKTLGLAERLRAGTPGMAPRLDLDPGLVRGDEPELVFKP